MKSILSILFSTAFIYGSSQSIEIRAGRSLIPGDYVALRYQHYTNGAINFSLSAFAERSKKSGLDYTAYGADLMAECASNREGYEAGVFGLRGGIGACWQVESEPWVYRGWPLKKRMSFGLVGEIAGEWFMTSTFSLKAFTQQKILFNPDIGRYRLVFGLGLVYRLSNY